MDWFCSSLTIPSNSRLKRGRSLAAQNARALSHGPPLQFVQKDFTDFSDDDIDDGSLTQAVLLYSRGTFTFMLKRYFYAHTSVGRGQSFQDECQGLFQMTAYSLPLRTASSWRIKSCLPIWPPPLHRHVPRNSNRQSHPRRWGSLMGPRIDLDQLRVAAQEGRPCNPCGPSWRRW